MSILRKIYLASAILLISVTSVLTLALTVVKAADPAPTPIAGNKGILTGVSDQCFDPSGKTKEQGDCTLCDGIQVIGAIIFLLQGILGTVALLMFIWGGLQLMFKGVNELKSIANGWATIKNAIIGIVLVFFSYAIVNLGLNLIVSSQSQEPDTYFKGVAQIFGRGWSNLCMTKEEIDAATKAAADAKKAEEDAKAAAASAAALEQAKQNASKDTSGAPSPVGPVPTQ